jgi:hypothetical protein
MSLGVNGLIGPPVARLSEISLLPRLILYSLVGHSELTRNTRSRVLGAQFHLIRRTVKRTLRQVLADSHVAAITIALLLLWTLDAMFRALWEPLYRVGAFLVTAILIWDLPYSTNHQRPLDVYYCRLLSVYRSR